MSRLSRAKRMASYKEYSIWFSTPPVSTSASTSRALFAAVSEGGWWSTTSARSVQFLEDKRSMARPAAS